MSLLQACPTSAHMHPHVGMHGACTRAHLFVADGVVRNLQARFVQLHHLGAGCRRRGIKAHSLR